MLLNVGFILSRQDCDYFVMHDVDLLPMNDDLKYHYPEHGPLHISSPKLHPLYHYPTFVGGILMMSRNQFETVNQMPQFPDQFPVSLVDTRSTDYQHSFGGGAERTMNYT